MQSEKNVNLEKSGDLASSSENLDVKSSDIKSAPKSPGFVSKILDKLKQLFQKIKEKVGGLLKKLPSSSPETEMPSDNLSVPNSDGSIPEDEPLEIPEIYLPETTEDLIWVLKKMPASVITKNQKLRIASAMTFEDRRVRDIMTPKDSISFVHENDFLGPLTLDKLYKSGLQHFPVVDSHNKIIGTLHTKELNSLEVRDTDRASAYLDRTIYYMRDDYTLEMALAAFSRTGSHFFVVVDSRNEIRGILSFSSLLESLFATVPKDDFTEDSNSALVARRTNGKGPFIAKTSSEYRPVQSVGARV